MPAPIVAVVPCRYDLGEPAQAAARLLRAAGLKVLQTDTPGLGPAYTEAWDSIPDASHVIHVDVGHTRDAWETVLDHRDDADIVIGSRFIGGGSHTGNPKRKFASKAMSKACSWAVLHDFHDWSSGLRTYSPHARQVLRDYPFTTRGHAWQIEALWAGWQRGLQVREVPIHYKAGRTSLNRQRAWEACRLLQRMVWSSPPSSVMRLTP